MRAAQAPEIADRHAPPAFARLSSLDTFILVSLLNLLGLDHRTIVDPPSGQVNSIPKSNAHLTPKPLHPRDYTGEPFLLLPNVHPAPPPLGVRRQSKL